MNTGFGVWEFFASSADRLQLEPFLREALSSPYRELTVQVRVPLDDGDLSIFPGYRVQYNGARGPYKGGVRFHPTVGLEEIRCLAALMTWKTALLNLPFGGGKGGVCVDPKHLSEAEFERLSRRFMFAVRHFVAPNRDVMAPDVNTDSRVMAWMFDEYSRWAGHHPEVVTGKPLDVGGSYGRESATGRGAALCLDRLIRARGRRRADVRIAVQGFGNAGRWFALCTAEMGYPIVGVADSRIALVNSKGIDTVQVVEFKRKAGTLSAAPSGESIERDAVFSLDAEVLAPSALEEAITETNCEDVRADTVLEIANSPVTAIADQMLSARNVSVVPDILASAGGVVASYLEWVQNQQRQQWSEKRVNDQLASMMPDATDAVVQRANASRLTLREAAYDIAVGRVADAERSRSYR